MSGHDGKDGVERIPEAKKPAGKARPGLSPELKELEPTPEGDEVVHQLHKEPSKPRGSEAASMRFKKSGTPFDRARALASTALEDQALGKPASLSEMAALEESRWGNQQSSGSAWTLVGAVTITLAVLALVGVRECSQNPGQSGRVSPTPEILTEASDEDEVDKWFHQRAGTLRDRVVDVLASYVAAEDDEARSKLVRFPGLYLERVSNYPPMATPRLQDFSARALTIKRAGDTAYVVIDCKDENFFPFRAYLTREGQDLKLDWSATVAWSEFSFADIKKNSGSNGAALKQSESGAGPMLLRCMLSRRNGFYAGPYNDRDYSVYMLVSPERTQHIWGYTKRDSPLDIELKGMLDHGLFVIDLKKNLRVTVRVERGLSEALPSQFELVELIHPEWVRP